MAEEVKSEGHNSDSPEKETILEKARRFLFGDDIFISYSRVDSTYALALANELTRNNLSCFLDQWGTPPGEDLPEKLINTIKRCSTMVLVGSKHAGESDNVGLEIKEFLQTERPIIPITFVPDHLVLNMQDDFNPQDLKGTLEQASWYPLIEGIAKTTEISSALKTRTPSDNVISRIVNAAKFRSRSRRLRKTFFVTLGAIAAVLLSGAIVGWLVVNDASEKTFLAEANANFAKTEANTAKIEADTAKTEVNAAVDARIKAESGANVAIKTAQERTAKADHDVSIAEGKVRDADKKTTAATKLAQEKTEFAAQQQQIADQSITEAKTQQGIADVQKKLADQMTREAKDLSYAANMRMADSLYKGYDIQGFAELLIGVERGRRGPEWNYLNQLTIGTVRFQDLPEEPISNIEFSPDSNYLLAHLEKSKRLLKLDARTGSGEPLGDGEQDDMVEDFAFSPNNRWLVCLASSADHMVLWNILTPTWERQVIPIDPTDKFMYVSFTPDSKEIVTIKGGYKITSDRWDIKTKTKQETSKTWSSGDYIDILAKSRKGQLLVRYGFQGRTESSVPAGEDDDYIVYLDHDLLPAGVLREPETAKALSANFSIDGEKIAILKQSQNSGRDYNSVYIFDTVKNSDPTYQPLKDVSEVVGFLGNFSGRGTKLTMSNSANVLALGFFNGIKILDLEKKKLIKNIPLNRSADDPIAFSPNGLNVAVNVDIRDGFEVGWIKTRRLGIWDLDSKHETFTLENGECSECPSPMVTDDNKHVAVYRNPETLELWNTFVRSKVTIPLAPISEEQERNSRFSDDGTYFYSYIVEPKQGSSRRMVRIQIWNVSSGKEVLLSGSADCGFASTPAFSSDAQKIALLCKGGYIGIWNPATGRKLDSVGRGIDVALGGLDFFSDDMILSVADLAVPGLSFSFDLKTGDLLPEELPPPADVITEPRFERRSPNGNWLVYGDREKGYFLQNEQFSSLPPVTLAPPGTTLSPSFSKDSTLLQVHTGIELQGRRVYKVIVKDLATMIDVVMEEATDSGEYELSESGKWVIKERMSGKIFYWDTRTGKRRILDQCWENRIYTSDENRLVTNCADGTIKFWDLRSGQEVLSISNDQPDIDRQSFSPGEDYLLTVSDKAVKWWRIKF